MHGRAEEWEIFNSMKEVHGIELEMELYGRVVDLLGRAGLLGEAEELIYSMSIEPSAAAWGALLANVRNLLKERGVKTSSGISMIDFDGVVLIFDIEEEEKEAELQNHGEKFAIAFGFINTASNSNPSCEEFKDE
ncbi:hypothetical protein POTOM_044876 [Populus tomentosa]|uniref:Pentatricopeptide repeat-containing protein n=1 Tax=Populus tomentosa TaxID=118781 RepID=A0A8X7YGN5_POPTO|nr:hypothetical protein POTOM_044876 [Populus tomentosa]